MHHDPSGRLIQVPVGGRRYDVTRRPEDTDGSAWFVGLPTGWERIREVRPGDDSEEGREQLEEEAADIILESLPAFRYTREEPLILDHEGEEVRVWTAVAGVAAGGEAAPKDPVWIIRARGIETGGRKAQWDDTLDDVQLAVADAWPEILRLSAPRR